VRWTSNPPVIPASPSSAPPPTPLTRPRTPAQGGPARAPGQAALGALLGLWLSCHAGIVVGQGGGPGEGLAARSQGRPDAAVTIYEMSDFQCPYCREFALETLPVLEREYVATGKVRLVYINFPLEERHRYARAAARVALCAARLGRFWAVHDLLFRRQPQWAAASDPIPYLVALADTAGADRATVARCVASKATDAAVQADLDAATRAGARSTPTFYIEGGLIEGAAPAPVFREVLDSIYRARSGHPAALPH
jgi:predicted DsbA family dithiol-disulfide isomerase